ncbi:MAG TPA: oligosaccharide flippase family protein [Chitinophagales bacterium]|nr:oligosaccharide flippase family protein [Chitinophagales bacterium]
MTSQVVTSLATHMLRVRESTKQIFAIARAYSTLSLASQPQMQKVFFRNLAFLLSLNLIIKPLWIFGIDRTVQNVVGAENYGLYFVLTNLSFLTQIILDLGISNYNNRLIAQQEDLLAKQLSHIFSIKLILSGVYLLVTLFAAVVLKYSGHQLYLLLLICFNQVLASLIAYLRSNISALHHFKVDSMLSVMDKALMLIVCGALLNIHSLRSKFIIDWFVYAQLGAYIITLVTAFVYVLSISGKISLSFSFSFSIDLLKKAFPFALLIGLMAIYGKIDGVMIQNLLPEEGHREAGLYASAYRLLDALNQFGYLFSVLLLPIFSRMLAGNKPIDELVKSSFTVIFIMSVIAALCLSFYSLPIMHMLYHESSEYSAGILSVLILTFVATSAIYVFSTLLTANNNLKELTFIALTAVGINLLLNFILIPKVKACGAAESSVATHFFIIIIQIVLAKKVFRFRLNYSLLLKLSIFVITTLTVLYFSKQLELNWIISMFGAAVLSLLCAFVLGLVQYSRIRLLFQ